MRPNHKIKPDTVFMSLKANSREYTEFAWVTFDENDKVVAGSMQNKSNDAVLAELSYCASFHVKPYIVITADDEKERNIESLRGYFYRRNVINLLHLAHPLCYNNEVNEVSLRSLVDYFGIPREELGTAKGDCAAIAKVYFELMKLYKISLTAESIISHVGGKGYQFLKSFIK